MSQPRVLATCFPQSGHLHPLIPTLRALADAGCPVLVATSATEHAVLAAAGLESVDVGPSFTDCGAQMRNAMQEIETAPAAARRALAFSRLFGTIYAPAAADALLACARSWHADAIVANLESLAGPLVAAQLGIPLVVNGFGVGLGADVCNAAANATAPLWERAGLSARPAAGLFDGLLVDPCPPSLRPDDVPLAPHRQSMRAAGFDGVGDLPALPTRRPLVYVTFGTNPHYATAKRLRTVATAIAASGAAAVITGVDPSALGDLPDGALAHRFVPQSLLLPHCDAVICHGGASTLLGALARGVPLVLMPLGADHFANTTAAVQRGVAVAVASDAGAQEISVALARVVDDRDFRGAAAAVSAEMAGMPNAASAAAGILAWLRV